MESCNEIKDGLLVIHTSKRILEDNSYKQTIGNPDVYKKQIRAITNFYNFNNRPVIYAARDEQNMEEIDSSIFFHNSINFISPSGERVLDGKEMLNNDAQIEKIILIIRKLVANQILPENPVIEAIGIWKKACYGYIIEKVKKAGINIYENSALCK